MAEEFQTGICNGNWWNSTRSATVPCTTATNDMGSFGWPGEMVEMKARSCEESVSVSGSSMVFQDALKSSQGSDSIRGGGGGSGGVLMDSTLQMMGFGLSPPTMDWNQSLFNRSSGRADSTFHSMFQQEDSNSRPTYGHETIMESADHQVQKDWSPKNFSCNSGDSSVTAFKQINQGLSSDQNHLNIGNSSDACTITCQGLPTSFSIDSPSSYGYPSTLLQGLFEPDFQSQQSSYDNRTMNYPSSQGNYGLNTDELSPWQKFPQAFKSSPPKQQQTNQLHFSNNTPFWNASVGSPRPNFFPLTQNQFLAPTYEAKSSSSNFPAKPKLEEVRDSNSVVKKASNEPALKKPRVETQSPLPTFKVRKEKLGDRITALQQLVSPFGKTDTASVLFEAIEYIKFLHDQVSVLSATYMKNGAPIQHQQQNSDKSKEAEIPQQDLRGRGLCLVPISSTFPVTTETTSDFWTPTFGGTYR